ncbi:hypothetical protein [Actinocrispum sp. NPDC049592]|uniref:hypothetical protein n=1 Tax=Actinocrispum sp. NPDC049592 TaxID=3154835 RepID=UPI003416B1D1
MVCVSGVAAADTDEHAERLASSTRLKALSRTHNRRIPLPNPEEIAYPHSAALTELPVPTASGRAAPTAPCRAGCVALTALAVPTALAVSAASGRAAPTAQAASCCADRGGCADWAVLRRPR